MQVSAISLSVFCFIFIFVIALTCNEDSLVYFLLFVFFFQTDDKKTFISFVFRMVL